MADERTPAQSALRFLGLSTIAALIVGAGAIYFKTTREALHDTLVQREIAKQEQKTAEIAKRDATLKRDYDMKLKEARKSDETSLATKVEAIRAEHVRQLLIVSTNNASALARSTNAMNNALSNYVFQLAAMTNNLRIAESNKFSQLAAMTNQMNLSTSNKIAELTALTNQMAAAISSNLSFLAKREQELVYRFLQPLPLLAGQQRELSSLSQLEKSLFSSAFIGADFLRELSADNNRFHDLPYTSDTHITAYLLEKLVYTAEPYVQNNNALAKLNSSKNTHLLITCTEAKTNLCSMHLYANPPQSESSWMGMTPVKDLFFKGGKQVLTVDYIRKEITSYDGNAIVYQTQNTNVFASYPSNAVARLQEFSRLRNRGPFSFEQKKN